MNIKLLAAASACIFIFSAGAPADTLHLSCLGCVDNGSYQNLAESSFQVYDAGGKTATGNFYLLALVPNNEAAGYKTSIKGTFGSTTSQVSGQDIGAFAPTKTNSNPQLSTVFKLEPANGHPLGAYLPYTDLLDPGATGYEVYEYSFGTETLGTPTFLLGTGTPKGTMFTATIVEKNNTVIATPNSQTLRYDAPLSPTPEPGYYGALFALSFGLVFVARRPRATPKEP